MTPSSSTYGDGVVTAAENNPPLSLLWHRHRVLLFAGLFIIYLLSSNPKQDEIERCEQSL